MGSIYRATFMILYTKLKEMIFQTLVEGNVMVQVQTELRLYLPSTVTGDNMIPSSCIPALTVNQSFETFRESLQPKKSGKKNY